MQPSGKAAPGKGSSGRREAHSESGEESDESDDEVSDDEDAPLPGELDDDDSDVADEDAIDVDSDDEDLPEADNEDDSDEQEEQQADSGAEDVPSTRAQANGRYAPMSDAGIAESSEGGSRALLSLWETGTHCHNEACSHAHSEPVLIELEEYISDFQGLGGVLTCMMPSAAMQMMKKSRKGPQTTRKWRRKRQRSRISGAGAMGKLARPVARVARSSMHRPRTAQSSAPALSAICTCHGRC